MLFLLSASGNLQNVPAGPVDVQLDVFNMPVLVDRALVALCKYSNAILSVSSGNRETFVLILHDTVLKQTPLL